jgi:ABC-type iron transport system FetAB ATPase subunit
MPRSQPLLETRPPAPAGEMPPAAPSAVRAPLRDQVRDALLYEARGGVVAIDGHDVTSLDPAWLRSKLALVQQEPVLFGVTVRENVARRLRPRGG